MKILCYHGIIHKRKKGAANFALKHIEKKNFFKTNKIFKKKRQYYFNGRSLL